MFNRIKKKTDDFSLLVPSCGTKRKTKLSVSLFISQSWMSRCLLIFSIDIFRSNIRQCSANVLCNKKKTVLSSMHESIIKLSFHAKIWYSCHLRFMFKLAQINLIICFRKFMGKHFSMWFHRSTRNSSGAFPMLWKLHVHWPKFHLLRSRFEEGEESFTQFLIILFRKLRHETRKRADEFWSQILSNWFAFYFFPVRVFQPPPLFFTSICLINEIFTWKITTSYFVFCSVFFRGLEKWECWRQVHTQVARCSYLPRRYY